MLKESCMIPLHSKSFIILRGAVYSAAFVWLWTWLAISVRSFDTQLSMSLPNWLRPVGFVLASAGAILPPSAGTWLAGDKIWNKAPGVTTGVAEWICTTDGASGAWGEVSAKLVV